jgi:hypothetical protein
LQVRKQKNPGKIPRIGLCNSWEFPENCALKLKTLAIHLAAHLDRKPSIFVELHRALREGLAAAIGDGIDGLAALPPLPRDLLNRDATELLTGKPGPGGGIATDPWIIAVLTIASLVDAPRSEVARKTFDLCAAASESGNCPLTGTKYFGEALMTILADPKFFVPNVRIARIDLSHDEGRAVIAYDEDDGDVCALTRFVVPNSPRPPKASFLVGTVTFVGLRRLHEFIRGNPDFNAAAEEIEASLKTVMPTT